MSVVKNLELSVGRIDAVGFAAQGSHSGLFLHTAVKRQVSIEIWRQNKNVEGRGR